MKDSMFRLTREDIFKGQSPNGGWNKAQLECLGLHWPPVQGWIDGLEGHVITCEAYERFLKLRGLKPKQQRHLLQEPLPFAESETRRPATGLITYSENGKTYKWPVGCMSWETESHLRNHLATWKPKAVFISGKIFPDKRMV